MIKPNSIYQPVQCRVTPNGFYSAYASFFDDVFVVDYFENDPLGELYVFDTVHHAQTPWLPKKGWRQVECEDDSIHGGHFTVPDEFGPSERELLTFLHVKRTGKVLRLVGPIGTGKSTFIRYMFGLYLPTQKLFDRCLYVPIDMTRIFRQTDKYTYVTVLAELERCVIDAYANNSLFRPGPKPPVPKDWDGILDLLRYCVRILGSRRVIVSFDNVDVFSPHFQHHMWTIVRNLAEATGITCVIAMRSINARHFSKINVTPSTTTYYQMHHHAPNIAKVARRRMLYFLQCNDHIKRTRKIKIATDSAVVSFEDLDEFVRNFIDVLMDDTICRTLESLTNCNVRLALRWMLRFLQSWNLNVVQMVTKLLKASRTPRREGPLATLATLVIALGLNNHARYFSRHSCLDNILSAQLRCSRADLLIKYRTLMFVSSRDEPTQKESLVSHLMSFCYKEDDISSTVDQLLKYPKRLLTSGDGTCFRTLRTLELSSSGRFYLDRLLVFLHYVQLTAEDSYLPHELYAQLDHRDSLSSRIGNAIRFIEFIGDRELEELRQALQIYGVEYLREYQTIYGDGLLATRMLAHARREIDIVYRTARESGTSFSNSRRVIGLAVATRKRLVDQYRDMAIESRSCA